MCVFGILYPEISLELKWEHMKWGEKVIDESSQRLFLPQMSMKWFDSDEISSDARIYTGTGFYEGILHYSFK